MSLKIVDIQALWNDQGEFKQSLSNTVNLFLETLEMVEAAQRLGVALPETVDKALAAMTLELSMDSLAYAQATEAADQASLNHEETGN